MTLADLARLAARSLPPSGDGAGGYVQPLAPLGILRQPRPTALEAAIYEPVLILVLEGRKHTVLGTDTYAMGAGQCLLASHDLPVIARITRAPYLALIFPLDLGTLRDLYGAQAALRDAADADDAGPSRSLAVHDCDARLVDALYRYLELADAPADAAVLGPLVSREIHYRLATAPIGGMLRALCRRDSHASAIARAIALLRSEFRAPLEIPALASRVGMSASAFHKHFKAITASSPLQYRKGLQLLEARRQLRGGAVSVSTAAFEVGYESAAQFSRDYVRRFGVSPRQDLPTR